MKIFDWVFDKFYHNDLLFLIILVYTNSSRPHRSLRKPQQAIKSNQHPFTTAQVA